MLGDRPDEAVKIAHVGFYDASQNASLPLWKGEGDEGIQPNAFLPLFQYAARSLCVSTVLPHHVRFPALCVSSYPAPGEE